MKQSLAKVPLHEYQQDLSEPFHIVGHYLQAVCPFCGALNRVHWDDLDIYDQGGYISICKHYLIADNKRFIIFQQITLVVLFSIPPQDDNVLIAYGDCDDFNDRVLAEAIVRLGRRDATNGYQRAVAYRPPA